MSFVCVFGYVCVFESIAIATDPGGVGQLGQRATDAVRARRRADTADARVARAADDADAQQRRAPAQRDAAAVGRGGVGADRQARRASRDRSPAEVSPRLFVASYISLLSRVAHSRVYSRRLFASEL